MEAATTKAMTKAAILVVAALVALAPLSRARAAAPAGAPAAAGRPAKVGAIPDVELFDQDGRKVRLYSDLIRGRTVAVSFVFTTCSTICSPMTAIFGKVQDHVGEDLGRDVQLLSITLDPNTDTPERLQAFSRKFGRREGWTFVTGPRDRVVQALKALGGFVAQKEQHAPIALIGNEAAGRWVRISGFSQPARIAEELARMRRSNLTSQLTEDTR